MVNGVWIIWNDLITGNREYPDKLLFYTLQFFVV